MRISKTAIFAVVGIVSLGASVAPWTFSGESFRLEFARQVLETTGMAAEFDGRVVLALLPRPRIKLENVHIASPGGGIEARADFLRGELRILPLFAGRLELVSAALIAPRLSIDLDDRFFAGNSVQTGVKTNEAAGGTTARGRLGGLSLVEGSAVLKSKAWSFEASVDEINLQLDWKDFGSPAAIGGTFRCDGVPGELAAWLGRPAELLRGLTSDMSLRFQMPAFSLKLNGEISAGQFPGFEGNLSATAPDLRAAASARFGAIPLPGALSGASLSGIARIRGDSISISGLRASVDGNEYEGALVLGSEDKGSKLSGTLAANNLDLTPMSVNFPELTTVDRRWSRAALPTIESPLLGLDLRLSARRARVGRTLIREAGFSLLSGNGRSEISLIEASAYNGIVKGRLQTQNSAGGVDMRASVTVRGVDAALLSNDVFRGQRVSGLMNGEISLASEGDTVLRALRALSGEALIDLRDGEFSGIDLEQALRRLEKRPLVSVGEVRGGRTGFATAQIDLKLDKGSAIIRKAWAKGPGVQVSVEGSANIPERTMDMVLTAEQAGAVPPGASPNPWLSMDITGDWDEAQINLDARSLIDRSPAAEPLLRGIAPPR